MFYSNGRRIAKYENTEKTARTKRTARTGRTAKPTIGCKRHCKLY
jgi:hypothetical protein